MKEGMAFEEKLIKGSILPEELSLALGEQRDPRRNACVRIVAHFLDVGFRGTSQPVHGVIKTSQEAHQVAIRREIAGIITCIEFSIVIVLHGLWNGGDAL